MRKTITLFTLALSLCLTSRIASAQDAQSANIKPAGTPSQALLESWNEIGRKLTAMAEDFPESKYDFKPVPAQRSFAEQLLHATASNYFFVNAATGKKTVSLEDPKRDQYKTKADVVAFVKKSFVDGAKVIQAKGDSGMNDLVVDPDSHQQMRVIDMAYNVIEHSGEHYGQLVVYYRVAGMVPPESRPRK